MYIHKSATKDCLNEEGRWACEILMSASTDSVMQKLKNGQCANEKILSFQNDHFPPPVAPLSTARPMNLCCDTLYETF